MHFGLRIKVMTFASFLVAAIVAVNAAVTLHTESAERKKQLGEQAKLFAKLTATDVVHTYGSLSWNPERAPNKDVRAIMRKFFRYYPDLARLTIVSQSGLVLWDSEGTPGHVPVNDPSLSLRLPLKEIDLRKFAGADGEEYMDILAPVAETGGPQFIKVRYIISYQSLKQRLSGIRNEFLLLAVLFIIIGILAAAVFTAKVINPVVKTLVSANEELKLLQTELVRSERMAAVGQLAAGLSHEIDNPIGVIMGFAELLLEEMPANDPRREDLARILDESRRCKRIVRGLLDFSRPPALGVMETDLADVLGQTVKAAESQRLFRDVKINLDIASVPRIMADPDRLRQVFMNLMINSAQAMPEGGKVDISLKHEASAGEILINFKDSGPGITQENIERIFEPFFTTKRAGEGTGLGLPICVRLLEEHGGRVWAESIPGQGASFTVALPDGTGQKAEIA